MELDGQSTKAKMETGYRPVFIGGRLASNYPDNLAGILIKKEPKHDNARGSKTAISL
jgi:hypothetical protein